MSTEEMIKQAFDKQAGEAGDHRRVLAEVARRTSSRRRVGAWGIALLTAGVAAAVVTPVVLFSGGGLGQPVQNDPGASAVVPAQPSATETVPPGAPVLTYQPSWLPSGATEFHRMSEPDGTLMRTWNLPGTAAPDGGPTVTLTSAKATGLPDRPDYPGEIIPVDINGVPGQLLGHDSNKEKSVGEQAFVEWMAAPGERLTVSVDYVANVRDVVVRIARSIRPDGKAAFVQNVRFGWLPVDMTEGAFSIRGTSPSDIFVVADTALAPRAQGQKRVTAQIDKDKPGSATPGDGTPVTVRGKQGVYIASTGPYGEVWVELANGLWLEVSGPAAKADLVKVADTMKINLDVKYPWLGQR
jgi:hypothetical protein